MFVKYIKSNQGKLNMYSSKNSSLYIHYTSFIEVFQTYHI